MGANPLLVTALGILVSPNMQGGEQVGLWDNNGALLASETMWPSANAIAGKDFFFVSLSSSVWLNPGQTYVLGALYTAHNPDQLRIGDVDRDQNVLEHGASP